MTAATRGIRTHVTNMTPLAYWAVPPAIALIIYWPGMRAWFQGDDFVWLNLVAGVHSWSDLGYALFHPTIHGTWRPFGERTYFLVLQSLFGYSSALPFRIVAFLGQFAIMALLSAIVLKLTGSRIAGFLTPIVWIVGDKLALTMVWNSNFNYIACGFFIFSALWFFIRYTETNRRGYLAAMWTAFVIGLGALEMTIVFPALTALHALACRRAYLKKTLPLFAASAVFAALHCIYAPNKAGSIYTMHFDTSVIGTLAAYWTMALKPVNLTLFTHLPDGLGTAGSILFSTALLGYAAYQAWHRNFVPLVFLGWFLILLLPVLPLREHVDQYYLGLPMTGLAMLAADAFAHAWRFNMLSRSMAVALLAFFLFESALVAHRASWHWASRSWQMRSMVMAVANAHRLHPDCDIVLQGIDDTLFWGAINQHCFQFLGLTNIYLAPGSEQAITPHHELGEINDFIIPAATLREDASQGRVSIYAWKGDHLEEVSSPTAVASAEPPAAVDRVDVADPSSAGRLSSDWYAIDQGFRWMPKRASVQMTNPKLQAQKLRVAGYAPAAALKNGAVHMTVSVNGVSFPVVAVDKADKQFEFEFPIERGSKRQIEVVVELDRTFKVPGDQRELGLAFGVFELR